MKRNEQPRPHIVILGEEEVTRRQVEEQRRDWHMRLEGMWIAFGCFALGTGIALLILEV